MTKSIREEDIEEYGADFILWLEEHKLYDVWEDSNVTIGMYNVWKIMSINGTKL